MFYIISPTSDLKNVNFTKQNDVEIYPNPAQNKKVYFWIESSKTNWQDEIIRRIFAKSKRRQRMTP